MSREKAHLSIKRSGPPNHRQGVSIIELLIVVAIIGIATMLSIPMYTSYIIRAQVSQGLILSGTHKHAVAAFHHDNGVYPSDNADANLAPANTYASKYVASIAIDGRVVSIEFGNQSNPQLNGRIVTLTARKIAGSVGWICSSGGAISDDHMPPACR